MIGVTSPARAMNVLRRGGCIVAMGFVVVLACDSNSQADTSVPTSIAATVGSGGSVSFSGTWSWSNCPSTTHIVGFALFESPNTPLVAGDSLDTLVHQVGACPANTGNWGPDAHTFSTGSHTVCVVMYDLRTADVDGSGNHSDDPDGSDRNTDKGVST